MAKYLINGSILERLANIIRTHSKTSGKKTVTEMVDYVSDSLSRQEKIAETLINMADKFHNNTDTSYRYDAILPEGLEEISRQLFYSDRRIQSVEVPSTVKYIGDYAFSSCINLPQLSFKEGLKKIGYEIMSNTPLIEEITIPESVDNISWGAFKGSSLKRVIFKDPYGWVKTNSTTYNSFIDPGNNINYFTNNSQGEWYKKHTHNYSDLYTIDVLPTETTDGLKTRHCECGSTKDEVIIPAGTVIQEITKDPTQERQSGFFKFNSETGYWEVKTGGMYTTSGSEWIFTTSKATRLKIFYKTNTSSNSIRLNCNFNGTRIINGISGVQPERCYTTGLLNPGVYRITGFLTASIYSKPNYEEKGYIRFEYA